MIYLNDNDEYEVIDYDGKVVTSFPDAEQARAHCRSLGIDDMEIDWGSIVYLREESGIYPKPEKPVENYEKNPRKRERR